MEQKPLIILTGPTAVGKTEASILLAKQCGGEIISADSMQVYRQMDIGTAKITPAQMDGVPHHLVDVREPDEDFNVFLFQKKAKQCIGEIHTRGKIPILVGGTGFYIQAVLYDIAFQEEEEDGACRKELQREAAEKGAGVLHERLSRIDPESAASIHPNNVKRVIRALEYHALTGRKFSDHNREQRARTSPYRFVYFVLDLEREQLYRNIDSRVDEMMRQGLVEEVERLLEKGYPRTLVSMQGLGYKEIAAALDGECTMEEAVVTLKRDTRHFAKRQLTWFRRERETCILNKGKYPSTGALVAEMLRIAKEKGVLA